MTRKNAFKRIKSNIFDVFDFSLSEQRGLFVLIVILLLLITFRIGTSYFQSSIEISKKENEAIEHFLAMQQHYQDSVLMARGQRNFYSGSPKEWNNYSSSRKLSPFVFDPNTMTFSDWKRMGFTDKESKQIVNYQSKGGRFFQKSDLKKLYCVSDDDYQLLEAYIEIHSTQNPKLETPKTTNFSYEKLDINTADSIELQKIPGIGHKTASRIVKYREKLGGFAYLHQLKEVYAIDSNRFLQIESYLYVDKTKIKKININNTEIKDLIRHPYIDYYLAKSIVTHRQNHGKYQSIDDIKKTVHFYDELYQKIIPYLCVE